MARIVAGQKLFVHEHVHFVLNPVVSDIQHLYCVTHAIIRVRISSTFSVLRPFSYLRPFLYFVHFTLTRVLRPFVKSGFLIGRAAQVEVKFGQKGQRKV